jgi:hypothetical protein
MTKNPLIKPGNIAIIVIAKLFSGTINNSINVTTNPEENSAKSNLLNRPKYKIDLLEFAGIKN